MAKRNYGSGNLVKRGRYWYIRFTDASGRRVEESTHCEQKADAEKKLKIALGEVAAGVRVRMSPVNAKVADACQLVIDDYVLRKKATTSDLKSRIKLHILPALGGIVLSRLRSSAIMAYANKRVEAGAAPASVNRELAIVRRGLRLARDQEPPWMLRIPKVEMLEEDNARTGFIERADYDRLRKELPEHLQIAFAIAYHVGARIGTIRSLRIDQVDMAAKVIRIEKGQTKNKADHVIPIYGDMEGYLAIAVEANKKFVCECKGKQLGLFRKSWASATKRAGLEGLLFHDLRRSAIRNMIAAGIPEQTAMKITGHKTTSMFRRYNILVERDIQKAAVKMAEFQKTGENPCEVSKVAERRAVN